MVQRIAINRSIGGFGISEKAVLWLIEHGSPIQEYWQHILEQQQEYSVLFRGWFQPPLEQNDPLLIQCLDELGQAAWGENQELKIVEIPDDVKWGIGESEEGYQWVYEKHRIWS